MHREIRSLERPFQSESNFRLYALTLLATLLFALEFSPWLLEVVRSLTSLNLPRPSSGITLFGRTITWAMIIAVLGAVRTLLSSIESLREGRSGADVAMFVAIFASILLGQPIVGAEVFFIGLIGECLEAFTFGRTQAAVRKLVDTCPTMCLVLRNGEEIKIRVADLALGERIRVLPGKRIPVDGVITEGTTSIDQSNLTGESLPVDKTVGDKVLAGTVNQFGSIVMEARSTAENSVMGRVIELTASALKQKGKHEQIADRYARSFLYLVLTIAAVTFLFQLWWLKGTPNIIYRAATPALAVLVVACPCALILATPAAAMAALARLARTGLLIKSAAALERLASIDTVAFDKTGTLTTGRMQTGSIYPTEGWKDSDLLRLAASVERQSEHPLAQALVDAARKQQLELSEPSHFQALPGSGVEATLDLHSILIGNTRLFEQRQIIISDSQKRQLSELDDQGQTPLLIAQDQSVIGIIGIWDTIRAESQAVLEQLHQLGLKTLLLTGDRNAAARSIASRVGIDELHAELLPTAKAEAITRLQKDQRSVAMIGDGVNDAPALAQSEVGLAIGGTGSDIAAEAGDMVLMGDPLKPLPLLFRLSRQMVAILKQNLLWFALGLNGIGVLLFGWIFPAWSEEARNQSLIWGAIYHQLGSLLVLLNSIRLLWFEKAVPSSISSRYTLFSEKMDSWIDRFSPHEISHWVMDHARGVVLSLLAFFLLLYTLTCLKIVPADSIGLVQRCGMVRDETLSPGLHITLPWPFDRVHLIALNQVRHVEVGFRTISVNPGDAGALTWTSSHGDILPDKEESLVATGDGSLLEIQAVVAYSISDPRRYLFDTTEVESILRTATESAIRETAARLSFSAILYQDRVRFSQEIETRLRSNLQKSHLNLGVDISHVNLLDVHPPKEVVKDYYEVTKSLSEQSRLVTEAHINREDAISTEQVAKTNSLGESKSLLAEKVGKSKAERDAFLALLNVLMKPLEMELSLFRYTVESAEATLTGRPKVLHDPKIIGPLQIIPEALRFRLPSLGDRPPGASDRNTREP